MSTSLFAQFNTSPTSTSLPFSFFHPFHVQLSIQARLEVIKRATKALRQLGEKNRKRGGDDSREQEGTDPAGMTFDEALAHLQQSQAHLDTLSHPFILSLKDSQEVSPICQTLEPFYSFSESEICSLCKCAFNDPLKEHTMFKSDICQLVN